MDSDEWPVLFSGCGPLTKGGYYYPNAEYVIKESRDGGYKLFIGHDFWGNPVPLMVGTLQEVVCSLPATLMKAALRHFRNELGLPAAEEETEENDE